jgi:hypothetical protein
LALVTLTLNACARSSGGDPATAEPALDPTLSPQPTVTASLVPEPSPAPPTATEIVLAALEAEAAGDVDRALSYYSSGGEWQVVDPSPLGILASGPCQPIAYSLLDRRRCLGGDGLEALMTHLLQHRATLEITDVRSTTTKNRNNTGAVVGETDVIYVKGALSFESVETGDRGTAEVLTLYALREGQIRTFGTVILGYPAESTTAAGSAADSIHGFYATTVTPADIMEDAHSGLWDIGFLPDGRYFLYDQGHLSLTGSYRTVGDQLTITDDSDCAVPEPGVHGGDQTSTYTWTIEDDALRLAVVEDGCPIREAILTSEPWARHESLGTDGTS